jgi:hypothetical protein
LRSNNPNIRSVPTELAADIPHDPRSLIENPALSELKALQYSTPSICNLPAGQRTECAIYQVTDVTRKEFLQPVEVERYLAQDRYELEKVSEDLSIKLGEAVEPMAALKVLTERMNQLFLDADSGPNDTFARSHRLGVLSNLKSAPIINQKSLLFGLKCKIKPPTIHSIEDVLKNTHSFQGNDPVYVKAGNTLFHYNAKTNRRDHKEVRDLLAAAHREGCHFDLNPHLLTVETSQIQQERFADIAKLLGAPESTFQSPPVSVDNGRYRLHPLSMCSLVRQYRDVIITLGSNPDCSIRLNSLQLANADRGVFPKLDKQITTTDFQQQSYLRRFPKTLASLGFLRIS